METESFTVSEFASYTGVSIRTLHYYEEKNLMHPHRDRKTGHRIYRRKDAIRLHQITILKSLGFPLSEIKQYIQSDNMDLGFRDTLKIQEKKLKKDRERIDTSLEIIHRTVHLIDQEKEIDSTFLFSLIAGMQTEKQQREISKSILKDEALAKIFDVTLSEKMHSEQKLLNLFKEVKRLAGKPSDHPEVIRMLEKLQTYLFETLELQDYQELTQIFTIDLEEEENQEKINQFLKDWDKLMYLPLTKQEEAWLDQIVAEFFNQEEKGDNL
ncbi:MerR family transcriptional regulator [Gracilibacillus massiliensis]|uniref:MerR family transcriptional regulator n=1 Tax=Gracilibacillus massiliensis TaxID=1564956 RepID=UPI00071C637D|nr:MerR family transcriptional regulator [Gracilibacillus massiliensis]